MDLIPCNEDARRRLAQSLFEVNENGLINKKMAEYVAKTFPSILLDIAHLFIEEATKSARENADPAVLNKHQLKPFLMFNLLLGKSPQVTGQIYSYFENSSFQPLPENLFQYNRDDQGILNISYTFPGFNDELVVEILLSYLKYLSFNPKWFSSIWNWSELGRFITLHTNDDIRYLAGCCLSIITRPTRIEHMSLIKGIAGDYATLINLQISHRSIFYNTFKPCIETKKEMAHEYVNIIGRSTSGYSYSSDSIAKVTNILLLKRDISLEDKPQDSGQNLYDKAVKDYIPVRNLNDTISKIAYSLSINRPCLVRGSCGSGKTAILDYIAAQTNRLNPPDYVKVHIGDQIDSKLLIGSYVCTEIPGQFEWQPGPLTKAMANGSWLVFEDFDSAPPDMAQVIHSVIENGNLSCVSSCPIKLDSPHPEFRILFTQKLSKQDRTDSFKLASGFVGRLCDVVDLPELTDEDLTEILSQKFNFGQLNQTIIELFRKSEEAMKECNTNRASRTISLRDLFKFCDRITARKFFQPINGKFTNSDLESIFFDAVDCFISSLPKPDLNKWAEILGQILNIASSDVRILLVNRKPEMREESSSFVIGRIRLESVANQTAIALKRRPTMAYTKQSLQLMESVSACIKYREPVLLVGETGVGKTSIVQHIANMMKTELVVINLSQQSDSSDLLGGYRPVEMREIMRPLHDKFEELFNRTFDRESNRTFLHHVNNCFATSKKNSQWVVYTKLVCKLSAKALDESLNLSSALMESWHQLHDRARRLSKRIMAEKDSLMALKLSEGSLSRAVKNGQWILLDEINLAEPDVLQCLLLILDSLKKSYVYMYNSGEDDEQPIQIHPNFRIFACMNPSTDIGKRDLDIGTRSRFSEIFVEDIDDKSDLRLIVEAYVKTCLTPARIESLVDFYFEVRARSCVLSDISGNSPVYSLRTLCRALSICSNNVCQNMEKSLLESLKITFLQQLNEISVLLVMRLIEQSIFKKETKSLSELDVPKPKDDHQYVQVQGFWIQKSTEEPINNDRYIITESVTRNLKSLARIISLSQRRLPILIQGNTSVGKTSLIEHLAKITGNKCHRINNHEHTDLQEYIGRYELQSDGELVFREGLLVRAMRKGHWIILDELNLAPCELLEALNRVLDENRELFIPETRDIVKAHSKFVLFATQNPPEEYAGRKLLSRAFRNRFIELHFDDIPSNELEIILERKCEMAPKYAKKIVAVMKELQLFRRESGCFNGKNGFMTMRDLFRWGDRHFKFKSRMQSESFFDWELQLAIDGLILLEGRVRTVNESDTVKKIIEKVFNRELDRDTIYKRESCTLSSLPESFRYIHFTSEFEKLFVQLAKALDHGEPVLLCGQTGCGKTTACQLYADYYKQKIITYNCHLNTESSDFVGSMRPTRREDSSRGDAPNQPFAWVDGPLVEAMKNGCIFLMDEISLADDAVLERINSVLEPSKSLTITERDGAEIFANVAFRIVATMNPGGDYGKKELSPALRNRFTEIYCHNTIDIVQIRKIIEASLSSHLLKPKIAPDLLSVTQQFLQEYYKGHDFISIRDVVSWSKFLNKTTQVAQPRPLSIQEAIINGASLVFFDQFGTCGHKTISSDSKGLKSELRSMLKEIVEKKFGASPVYPREIPKCLELNQDIVKFKKFYLSKGPLPIPENIHKEFITDAPIVRKNMMKIVRAMQLDRPILLEGDPGAGKTSVVGALAKLTGHKLVRINLSEQTDISDLFGSDLPDSTASDDGTPSFCWRNGPVLQAINESSWILLDEMNLASQSVLEGLNACLDHRGEIYIAELNKTITVNRTSTRIFACQNPYNQGAARKGLPQSFLNRFTSIFVESHTSMDLSLIIEKLHPNLSADLVSKMVEFNSEVGKFLRNYEFNLRDILYWCDLMTRYVKCKEIGEFNLYRPDKFVQFVYLDRIRSAFARAEVTELFERVFGYPVYEPPYRELKLGELSFIMGRSVLPRKVRLAPHLADLCILKYQMPYIESLAKAIEFTKMPILVGESGVGKRSMVKILAGLTGNELNIVGANREMDTVELLGSFEQKSLQREVVELVDEAKDCVTSIINSISHKQSSSTWRQFFNHIWATLYVTSIRDLKLSNSGSVEAYRFQLCEMADIIKNIQSLCEQEDRRCSRLLVKIENVTQRYLHNSETMCSPGNFEWIDSILVKSVRQGHWLMIEDANLMNPATLDRLNSLVEPNGTLSLNEKGSGRDGIESIVPHRDFRLILTVDPEHGELSRAMRNRGTEISIQSSFFFEDFLILLNQNGFEPEEKKACMAYCIMQTCYDTHTEITGERPEMGGSLLSYFGLNYISTLTHQVRRGGDVDEILADLLVAYYSRRGFFSECSNESLRPFIKDKMNEYRKKYEVSLIDDRYKWMHFRHDLVSLTGGDAIPAMLDRDNRIFYDDVNLDLLLKPDEIIDNIDIVNTCINVKIFLEIATHGDFEYRKGFIKETFQRYPDMMRIVNSYVDSLHSQYIPMINNLTPRSDIVPISEIHIDGRNSPDIDYYFQCINYSESVNREGHQNRWLLTLHRIMLRMIVELVEERSMETPGNTSLWKLSELVRTGQMMKEDLVRPVIEFASDLFDLLHGILRGVSQRCFDNQTTVKVFPKIFWINYFICKLKRGYNKAGIITVCNQLPMLWALTYQKILVPLIKDCDLADLTYKNKKFSGRIQHISDSLDMTLTKPGHLEKLFYRKVVNMYASTSKLCESLGRDVDKFFVSLVGRYDTRSQTLSSSDNLESLAAAGLIWSNSTYMSTLYSVEDQLLEVDRANLKPNELMTVRSDADVAHEGAQKLLMEKRAEYSVHEERLDKDQSRAKHILSYRRKNAFDQFAPVWQLKFIQTRQSKLSPAIVNPSYFRESLCKLLSKVNGVTLSPKYYSTLVKFLRRLEDRLNIAESCANVSVDPAKTLKEDVDMYTTYLTDHLIENKVLDIQIVGWTKLRVTTCDLPSLAPLIPEYSPMLSLVGGYSLDISHLKLNSYQSHSIQLDSIILYLWRNYVPIKLNLDKNTQDLELARNLMHLRSRLDVSKELLGDFECNPSEECRCIDEFIKRRVSTYEELIRTMSDKLVNEDAENTVKAVKLIYFGYLNYLEYAPIFTIDPSLKIREKLEIYKSELAHVKLDLHFRNTLYYWKTGENLQLNEVDPEDAALYPFCTRILVERRAKLERSIGKLRREHSNRPKSDDGSLYFELRQEVEVVVNRYTNYIHSLMNNLVDYVRCKTKARSDKFTNLISRCRMVIKSLEKTISALRTDYALYTDLTTNFLVGMSFVLQGLRCLYSRLEQQMQIQGYGFTCTVQRFMDDITRIFSFNNLTKGSIELVLSKLNFFPRVAQLCPPEKVNQIQSVLLKTVLIQLNHHIAITPSDIERCIPIVRRIADLFHAAWLERKLYIEEQRKLKEEIYQFKTVRTTLGDEISYERQEFLDICSKFPTYEHVFQSNLSIPPTSTEKENLETEEKLNNLNRSVDLSKCIDICKAHYKFTKEASRSLLGQVNSEELHQLPSVDLSHVVELEAETLYTIIRHCIPGLGQGFDANCVECHILQASQLTKSLNQKKRPVISLDGLKSSIEILDEEIFDIYYSSDAHEALKLQKFINSIDDRISALKNFREYDNHPTLSGIIKLITKISSFLITDPLMKFVTGSHSLLGEIEQWNYLSIPRDHKMIDEANELIELIKSWRSIEVESWRSSLHRIKRKYIDGTLCDLWFRLYQYFSNPIAWARTALMKNPEMEDFVFTPEYEELIYVGFTLLIRDFLEESTLGDYQIRLDLVFSFAIQMRFASLYELAKPDWGKDLYESEKKLNLDFEKLTTYVYNIFRQYQGLFDPLNDTVKLEEKNLTRELNTEIRIVNWQGRNLWEIKKNFRISHCKLNKVMNKYLDVLRRPIPALTSAVSLSAKFKPIRENKDSSKATDPTSSEHLGVTLASINMLVSNVILPSEKDLTLESLKKAPKIVLKMKQIYSDAHLYMSPRYVENLVTIEEFVESSTEAIVNFHSHKVREVVINPKDSKETIAEKHKLCRQMRHSKKFEMQRIFKSLQQLGTSYQRGLNYEEIFDGSALSVEPLRGMIQTQSHAVLKAVSRLVDDSIIIDCNERYRDLIAITLRLLSYPKGEDLDTDQMNRIRGYSIDMMMDAIKLKKSAAAIYKHLMDIQATTTTLTQLQERSKTGNLFVYNFFGVHKTVQQFNELVSRAYMAISKLENFTNCCAAASELESSEHSDKTGERDTLKELILEADDEQSMMTRSQIDHIKRHLLDVREKIAKVSHSLRDILKNTIRNHVYGDDDLDQLQVLYDEFVKALSELVSYGDHELANERPGTVLGSVKMLLNEAEQTLKPNLKRDSLIGTSLKPIDVAKHPNIGRLNIRLKKLVRRIMLAVQETYKEELKFKEENASKHLSDSAKRKLKPFNYIDSSTINHLLRVSTVSKHVGDCFLTLNREEACVDIRSVVTGLAPLLFIYTQDVASYLNVILASLSVKLKSANQLMTFFSDLVMFGFGLPYKAEADDGTGPKSSKASGDNTGFGEGEGDTDVSKKLEFESQLDELKRDGDRDKEEKGAEQPVEAHDDGVEMSEDIDAKVQGPEDDGSDTRENEKDDQEEEADDDLAELDKEFDKVDQDEVKLDEKLWDDKDEPPEGEDDEEDLRMTDADSKAQPDREDSELQAKDQALAETKGPGNKNEPKTDKEADERDDELAESTDQINEAPDQDGEGQEEDEGLNLEEDEGLNLEEEAEQALNESTNSEIEKNQVDGEQENLLDMSISEEADSQVDAQAKDDDTDIPKQDDNDKSEGELSDDDIETDEGQDKSQNSDNLIDDEDIDNQLEVALQSQYNEKLDDAIDDTIRNQPSHSSHDSGQQLEGKKIGSHVLYDIFTEEESDPIDYDDTTQGQQQEQNEDAQPNQKNNRDVADKGANDDPGTDQERTVAGPVPKDKEASPDDEAQADQNEKNKSTKRTFAETCDDQDDDVKRQKITECEEKNEKVKEPEQQESRADRSNAVRHIEKDESSAIEVVDLVSDDEQDVNTLPEQPDRGDEITSKPELKAKSDSEKRNSQIEDIPDVDIEIGEQEKASENTQENQDGPMDTSSISSLESGELDVESDPEDRDVTKRDLNTSYNTNLGLLKYIMHNAQKSVDNESKTTDLMGRIDQALGKDSAESDSVDVDKLTGLWLDCTKRTGHLVHELCQQLQIVLQPTKMSKYKGDYKSGKRLNMRKIISYIASHYRKDKIWLRRTKPSKRTYNITLAVDNSSSMSENNCRQMTYQSLALLAKSLSLIEAGSLSVVSFGENVKCIQEFGQPYVDALGAQWLRELRFNESKTSYSKLLKHSCESFAKQAKETRSQLDLQGNISQLLIILSDGRNVTSEEEEVKSYLRLLKSMGVLTLFVIIDDTKRNDGCSIVDVKRCVGLGSNIRMSNYMELFPFPFYVLLRQLETMPSILGDALRQWFELVSGGSR